jgi:Restriction endonuclease.
MADAMQECGAGDKALKVFMHLRPDPVYGPKSSLSAGIIHARMGLNDEAIQDYEIGLKLKDIPQEIYLELNYRIAQCFFSTNKIALGLQHLTAINNTVPNYKDVATLISRYKELNQNSNLQLYLNSGTSDFVALCRNLVSTYYAKSFVKISDVEVQQDSVEILCEVENAKWDDTELFRFFKTTGSIGELLVRDFHAKVRDKKVDRGFCVTPGSFSEEAHKYVEGRPIDLIEKSTAYDASKKKFACPLVPPRKLCAIKNQISLAVLAFFLNQSKMELSVGSTL